MSKALLNVKCVVEYSSPGSPACSFVNLISFEFYLPNPSFELFRTSVWIIKFDVFAGAKGVVSYITCFSILS